MKIQHLHRNRIKRISIFFFKSCPVYEFWLLWSSLKIFFADKAKTTWALPVMLDFRYCLRVYNLYNFVSNFFSAIIQKTKMNIRVRPHPHERKNMHFYKKCTIFQKMHVFCLSCEWGLNYKTGVAKVRPSKDFLRPLMHI